MLFNLFFSIVKSPKTDFAFAKVRDGMTFAGVEDTMGACIFRIIQAAFKSNVRDPEERLKLLKDKFPDIKGVATVVEAVRAILAGYEATSSLLEFSTWAERHHFEASSRLEHLLAQYDDWIRLQSTRDDEI